MKYQLKRTLSDKKKLGILVILLLIPSLEIIQILYDHLVIGMPLPYPLYATFLSRYSRGHILQVLYLWFLPIYLLILSGEESMEDFRTGYKNILLCKSGKNRYIKDKLKSGFLLPFFIVMSGLVLNLILLQIVCHNGTYLLYGGEYMVYDSNSMPGTLLFEICYSHPLLANIAYISVASFFAGLVGMLGTIFAIVLHDRKLVYAFTFALWFIPILFKNSFMLVFQPFSEYGFRVIAPLALWVAGLYTLLIVIMTIWEVKFVEI